MRRDLGEQRRRDIGASRPVLRTVGKAAKNDHNRAGIEEIEISGPRHVPPFALSGGLLAATLFVLAPAARAESGPIPDFASAEHGWQSNVADWQDPPAGPTALGEGATPEASR